MLAAPAQAAPGDLDSTFGADGRVMTPFPRSTGAAGVAIRADGKVVAVGSSADGFALARYGPRGHLDRSFGGDGKVTTGSEGEGLTRPRAVAVQRDGKIVVAGSADDTLANVVSRYLPDGRPDPGFGEGGTVGYGFGSTLVADVALQPDGKIVVAGYTELGLARWGLFVDRLLADGSLDPGFSGDVDEEGRFPGPVALQLQPDGKILVGTSVLVRLLRSGARDPGFGDGGVSHANRSSVRDLAIQPNGRIVAATNKFREFSLERFLANGKPDPSLGGDGQVTTDFRDDDEVRAVAVQPNGKLVLGGYTRQGNRRIDFALARYGPTGAPDTRFSGDGKLTTAFGSSGANPFPIPPLSLALQRDGRIVAAGGSGVNFALARYHGDAP